MNYELRLNLSKNNAIRFRSYIKQWVVYIFVAMRKIFFPIVKNPDFYCAIISVVAILCLYAESVVNAV